MPARRITGPLLTTIRMPCSLPWSAMATDTVCWICASPPTGGQDSVQTPPEIVTEAPDVVFAVDHEPVPAKNGSPILVPTAGRVSSTSLIHTRILLGVSSTKAVSSLA